MTISHYLLFWIKHLLIVSLLFLLCCSTLATAQDTIYFVSLNKAVRAGHYDGVRTLKEAKAHGNFGLGSTAGIASELVMVNDTAYQFSADVPFKSCQRIHDCLSPL